MRNPKDPDLAKLGLVALRRLGDDEAVEGALERTAQRKVATPAIAEEAFYAEAWPLTRRLFALIPKDARTEDAARLALVAAVADGLKEAPAEALAMFEQDDPRRRALAHMFERAPAFNPTDPEPMQRYAARVADEVDFIRTELFE